MNSKSLEILSLLDGVKENEALQLIADMIGDILDNNNSNSVRIGFEDHVIEIVRKPHEVNTETKH